MKKHMYRFRKLRYVIPLFVLAALPMLVFLIQRIQEFRQYAAVGTPVVQEEKQLATPANNHFPQLITNNQKVFVSWGDTNASNLAERDEETGTFVTTKMGSAGTRPFYFTTNVFASSDGTLHYVWIDNGTTVHHRKRPPGGTWSADATVAMNQNFANQLGFFMHQNTAIIMWRLGDGQLTFVSSSNGGTSWSAVSSIPGAASYGGIPKFAAAPDGKIYFAWNSRDLNIHLGQWTGTNFTDTTIIQGNGQLFNPNLVISPQGQMYIATRHVAQGPYLAERQANGTWTNTNVFLETKTNGAGQVAIASDANGNVHVAWSALLNNVSTVKYAVKSPGGVFTTPVTVSTTDSAQAFKSNVNIAVSVRASYTIAHIVWDSGADTAAAIRYARVATPLDGGSVPQPPTAVPAQPAQMGSTKLGLFTLIPCSEYDVAVDGGPRIVKIAVGQDAHPDFIAIIKKYKQRYPSGIAVLRVYDNTGTPGQIRYYKTNDPVASARDYYNKFIKPAVTALKSRGELGLFDYITGDNEFTAFDFEQGKTLAYDSADSWEWYGRFWAELAIQIKIDSGKKPLVGQIPVGNPINLAFLDRMIPSLITINQQDGALSYHGYTRQYTTDVAGETDNDSLYYRRIHDYIVSKGGPSDLEYIIGEAGVDAPGGWKQFGNDKTRYQNWLTWYDGQLKQDAYVLGAAVFQMCDSLPQNRWASFDLAPLADWLKNYFGGTPASSPTPTPGNGEGEGTPLEPATIIIRLRNEVGQPVVVNTGGIFVDNLADSDNYNLAGPAVQDRCSKRSAPGEYECVKYASNWYAGMGNTTVPSGFCIVDGGTRREENDTPLPLAAGGTITVNVVLKPGNCGIGASTPTPVASNILNCLNIQGPTTVRVGQPATYLTQFSSQAGYVKAGMGALKTDTTGSDPSSWAWNPAVAEVQDRSGSKSFTWTPTTEGTYQLFCRAINAADNSECRGSPSSIQSPISTCTGPGGTLVVNVTSQGVVQGTIDMCSQIVLFGSGTAMTLGQQTGDIGLIPGGSISVAAVAKPGYNIKTYTFAFYNADNQPTDPKPLSFEAGKQFIIDSQSNNIQLTWDDLNKPDLNFANRKPTNILIAAFFTDAIGRASSKSPACIAALKLTEPTPISRSNLQTQRQPLAAARTTPTPAVYAGLAVVGIALVAVTVYFFFT